MAGKTYPVRNAFNGGEISELVDFRDDVAKYTSACKILENFVPLVEGGAKKMPGSFFAGGTALGGSMFTGSIVGTTLNVTAVNYGVLQVGQALIGAGIAAGTILSGSGSPIVVGGSVLSIGVDFADPVYGPSYPNIAITINGDGTGAFAYVHWTKSGPLDDITWTPILTIGGGTGYTHATATVTILRGGQPGYPNGITLYPCTISSSGGGGGGGTGVGGVGTYTVSISQTVGSEQMQTAASGKSRLVPFQFSTIQGAILELSQGIIRIWEGASQGQWSLGIALQVPAESAYNPATAYVDNNVVLIGPTATVYQLNGATPELGNGILYISSPYGSTNASTVPILVQANTIDTLQVSKIGSSPGQGILIYLAKTTASKNSSAAIQAAIRALGSLNSSTNYLDLTAWTVTPDATYYATPWTSFGAGITATSVWANANWVGECVAANQYDQFPLSVFLIGSRVVLNQWNSAYWIVFDQSSEPPIQLATPYLEGDLFSLDCSTQSADVLWIFHPNYPPACIQRLSSNSWQYSTSLPGQQITEPPYRGTLDVVKTGYSGLGQSITNITAANPCVVTVSSTSFVFPAGSRVYLNEISGMVELNQGEFLVANPVQNSDGTFSFSLEDPDTQTPVNSTGYLAYVSGGFAVSVVPLFAATGDYPACGTLYQERLCVGGSNNNPTQMNGSVQDDYPDFICDPNAEDYAIQFTLVSNKLDQIINMIGTPNALVIGTAGGVWIMAGGTGSSLSQTNVVAAKQTSIGVSALQPQLIGSSAIFVSRSARIVLFLTYNFVSNQWDNYDLTRLNRVITLGPTQESSGIAQTSFQIEPYPILWAVRNDGQLIGLVFNTQDQVYAWFRVNMLPGGGSIESAAVISGQNQEDQLAVVVSRTVNGVPVRYVEYFMPQELFSQLSNAYFVNCGQQLQLLPPVSITGINNGSPCIVQAPGHGFSNGMQVNISDVQGMTQINQDATQAYTVIDAATNSFGLQGMDSTMFGVYSGGGTVKQVVNQVTGISYLIGQQVTAVGDGALILPPTTVTGDTVVFPYYANVITIGIPYQATLQPTNPVLSSQGGTTRGMKQKLSRVTLSLYQAMGGKCGVDLDHMYNITYGPGTQARQPQMSTEEYTRDLDCDWDDESTFYITQSDPFPFTVRGLVWRMTANQD